MSKNKQNELYTTVLWRDEHKCTVCSGTKSVAVYKEDPDQPESLSNLKAFCITCICEKRGLKLKVHNPPAELILELRKNGFPDSQISKKYLGCTRQRLYQIVEEYTAARRKLALD